MSLRPKVNLLVDIKADLTKMKMKKKKSLINLILCLSTERRIWKMMKLMRSLAEKLLGFLSFNAMRCASEL